MIGFLLHASALVVGGGFHTQTHPDPLVSFGIYFLSRRSDRKRVSRSISDIH
jgi:hypothetical protein